MTTVSWVSTLPSTPATLSPLFCTRLNGGRSRMSRAADNGPCPRTATRPVRGSGSVMSTLNVPFRASWRPSAAVTVASGRRISKLWSSSRTRARGASSVGQLSTRLKARLAASSVREPCEGAVVAAQPEPAPTPAFVASRNEPPCSQPRTRCLTTQSRERGASGAGQMALKMLAGIGPILPSRRACIAPAMSATSPSAEISAPPAFSRNSESTARPRSGATNPRAVQSSIVSCGMCGGSAPIHPPADRKSKAQRAPSAPSAVCATVPVNCTRLSPHTSTEGAIVSRRAALS